MKLKRIRIYYKGITIEGNELDKSNGLIWLWYDDKIITSFLIEDYKLEMVYQNDRVIVYDLIEL